MANIDATTVVSVPIWGLICSVGTLLVAIGSSVWWFLNTFFKRADAKLLEEKLETRITSYNAETREKLKDFSNRLNHVESIAERVASDVSYIRGWIEAQTKQ